MSVRKPAAEDLPPLGVEKILDLAGLRGLALRSSFRILRVAAWTRGTHLDH
jgi:hypothetical protein